MGKYSKEDIIRMVHEDDVEFIRMQFTDIFGQLKNVAITASQIEKAVNNEIMIDGSSIEGFVRIQESDQYLHPDLDTFTILPWRPQHGKVARLICDVYNPDGTPFIGDPRGALRRMLKKAADMGYSFNVGPECEFFLFQTDEDGKPTTTTNDEAGYFDLGPLDHGESTRREICMALETMGFEIEASHHEVAAGQHEIDFKYAEALAAADNIMTFKLAVKTLAQKNGLHATFMPKPIFGINGSGMHTNMSLFKDGKNVFFDETGDKIGALGHEFGAVTGRKRRCGWIDLVALKYSVMINGVTKLIMMKSDVLDTFATIKACVAYKMNGEEIDYFPYDITEGVEPVYAELPGWQTDMTKMQSEDEFPEEFNAYLSFLEEQLGVPIKIVSVGPDREQTIERYTEE